MGKSHTHHHNEHSHPLPSSASHLTFFLAIFLNLAFVIIQLAFATFSHSSSLLADAGHNFSDVLALLLSWLSFYLSKKKSNSVYSYGYRKSTILASLVNAILLTITCTLIIFEASYHLIHPADVLALPVIIVACVGILINGGSALLFLKPGKTDLNVKSAFLHLLYDALISFSVVLGGILIYFTHWNRLDPFLALLITLLILKSSLLLLKKTLDLSLDCVPKEIDLTMVFNYLSQLPEVTAIHDLHVWAISTTENALTVHLVRPSGNFTSKERQEMSAALDHQFHITHTTIQVEEEPKEDCLHAQNC